MHKPYAIQILGRLGAPCVQLTTAFVSTIISYFKDKQDVAQALSSHINEAYQGLLTPLTRAEYLLECHRLPISEADQLDDIDFISKIMHVREQIENAVSLNEVQPLIDENRGSCLSLLVCTFVKL